MGQLTQSTAEVQILLDEVPGKEPGNANIQEHISSTTNPHGVSYDQLDGDIDSSIVLSVLTNDTGLVPEDYGVGPVWENDIPYWSNSQIAMPVRNRDNIRNRDNRANSDQYINFAEYTPIVPVTANGVNPAIVVSPNLDKVECHMDSTSADNQFCGVSVTHNSASDFWDFSAQHTYPGQAADTVYGIDLEFPETLTGDDRLYSLKFTILLATTSTAIGDDSDTTNAYKIENVAIAQAKNNRCLFFVKQSEINPQGVPDISEVRRIDVRIYNHIKSVVPVQVNVRGLYVNMKRKGRVVFSFDTVFQSWYTEFFKKYAQPRNWGCTASITTSTLGQDVGGSLTITPEMLQDVVDNSDCEICSNTYGNDHMVRTSTAVTVTGTGPWTVTYDIAEHGYLVGETVQVGGSSYLVANGLKTIDTVEFAGRFTVIETVNADAHTGTLDVVHIPNKTWDISDVTLAEQFFVDNNIKSVPVFVMPYGDYSRESTKILTDMGYISTRATDQKGIPFFAVGAHYGLDPSFVLPGFTLHSTRTAAGALSTIDNAMMVGADMHIYGHRFEDNPIGSEFSTSELKILIDGIQERIESGLCDVPIGIYESVINY